MEIYKKEIISMVVFKNGVELVIGGMLDDGRIVGFEVMEDGVEVILEWEWEGWSVIYDSNGEVVE
jgi:hypothetical protein